MQCISSTYVATYVLHMENENVNENEDINENRNDRYNKYSKRRKIWT